MKKVEQLRSMFLLLSIAILGSTLGAQRAYADTVSDYTGTFYSGYGGANFDESIGPIIFTDFAVGEPFFFTNPVTSGTLNPCTYSPCSADYSGTFIGGTMSLYLDDPAPPSLVATITGGSYSGSAANPCIYPYCSISDEQTFTFTGQWANGWTSVGTFFGSFELDGAEPSDIAILTMTTTTPSAVPEPSGMTLMGTGMVLVAAFLRLRLRNGSTVS